MVSTAGVCVCVCERREGLSGWRLLHDFLWDFLPCIIVHVSPSEVISKAAVETKGPLQTGNNLWLSASVEKDSPQITCSTAIYDVINSTFAVCTTREERQRVDHDSPGDLFQHCASHALCSSCHTRAH